MPRNGRAGVFSPVSDSLGGSRSLEARVLGGAVLFLAVFMLLSLFAPHLGLDRVSQIFPVVALFLMLPWLQPIRKSEFQAMLIAGVLVLLFFMNIAIFGRFYYVGFAPIVTVSVAMLGMRAYELNPKSFTFVASLSTLMLSAYCVFAVLALGVAPNDLIYWSRNHLTTVLLACALLVYALIVRAEGEHGMGLFGGLAMFAAAWAMAIMGGRASSALALATGLLATDATVRLPKSRKVGWLLFGMSILLVLGVSSGLDIGGSESYRVATSRFEDRGLETVRYETWREIIREGLRSQHWVGMPSDHSYTVSGRGTHSVWLQILTSHGIVGLSLVVLVFSYLFWQAAISLDYRALAFLVLVAFRATLDDNPYSLFLGPLFLLTWWLTRRTGRKDGVL